jgi:AcrR family transcriptional regulator
MSPETATGNRRATSLSREQVALAALEVLDREGLEGLSMRRLAGELGVGTMTLYGYFRGKRELLDAVVDVATEDFVAPEPVGGFREQLVAYSLASFEWLLRHPMVVQLRGEEAIIRPAALGVSERVLQLLLDAGLGPEEAARAFRVLFTYLFGSALFAPREATEDERRALLAAHLSLPEERFPAIREAAPYAAAATGGRDQFLYGLECIVDGIEARKDRYSAASSHQ